MKQLSVASSQLLVVWPASPIVIPSGGGPILAAAVEGSAVRQRREI